MCLKRCKMRRGWWGDPPNVPTNWEWTEKQTIFLFLCCSPKHATGPEAKIGCFGYLQPKGPIPFFHRAKKIYFASSHSVTPSSSASRLCLTPPWLVPPSSTPASYHHLTHVAAPTVLKVLVPSRCFGRPSKLPHFLTERNGSQTQNRSALWSFSWRDMSHVQCPSKNHFEIWKPVGDNLTASLANTNYICCVDERSQNVESKHILI
jgi:hypothetical protein